MADSLPHDRWPAYARVPPFLPVPLRARADGWTAQRQANFIGYLAETGCVAEAARRAGMSRMAAWRLRNRPGAESLAHAWDAVLAAWRGEGAAKRKVTPRELAGHAFDGPFVVTMRGRRFVRVRRKPSNSALLRYARRVKKLAAGRWSDPR